MIDKMKKVQLKMQLNIENMARNQLSSLNNP